MLYLTGSYDIDRLDIQLVNGSAPNEGRVLIRWSPDSSWTALCYGRYLDDTVSFQMCRRLGYPFACGQNEAGADRGDNTSLGNIQSVLALVGCSALADDFRAGGCTLSPVPARESFCTHDQDVWLSCGYSGTLS